jgi:small-conductance mechanosensitive channel
MHVFGVKLVGINPENGRKLLFTVVLVLALLAIRRLVRRFGPLDAAQRRRATFWIRQSTSIVLLVVGLLGVVSIWFDDPRRLTTGLGLVTAGLAFALQRVVLSMAGYLTIVRGNTFRVGDRIVMGGVRGDVVRLGFMQTHLMEMGQPPPVEPNAQPAMWVRSRQYTGRIVTVTNDKIFDEPVYNYTREFPFVWEELRVPIPYSAPRDRAERILLEAVRRHTTETQRLGAEDLRELQRRYGVADEGTAPRVYWRLTDNWLELTARFVVADHGIRVTKDAITRDLLAAFDAAGLSIASATYEIVGLPELRVRLAEGSARPPGKAPETTP